MRPTCVRVRTATVRTVGLATALLVGTAVAVPAAQADPTGGAPGATVATTTGTTAGTTGTSTTTAAATAGGGALPPVRRSADLATTEHPTRRVCDRPGGPHRAACLSVVRTDVTGPRGLLAPNAVPTGFGPADLQDAYDLPSATAGDGQTVAVVDAFDDPNAEADLAVYRTQFGLPPCTSANGCFRRVDQRGGTDYPVPQAGWAAEIALDLDMVSAACPRCDILLVEADDNALANLGAAVDTAVRLGARYVSNSYGAPEDPAQLQYDVDHYDQPGVVVTASSGDGGFGVSYPAASRHVTAVGGTSLRRADTLRGWSETAWSGAGSGCSALEDKPSHQSDPDCARRTVADVSAVADPNTGVAVYHTYQSAGWSVFGGTSAAAPIVASVYALAGPPDAGDHPNRYPYATPSMLNDVTSGGNGSCGGSYLCTGTVGYDGPTGLGTPAGVGAFAAPGPHGRLSGAVTDAAGGGPVADAVVTAGQATARTDAHGRYSLSLPVGVYDVTVSAFRYEPAAAAQVPVLDGTETVRDVALTARPAARIGGAVTDGSGQGWPLYASVEVVGEPVAPVHTDPFTGRYAVTLPLGRVYTLRVTTHAPGYRPVEEQVRLLDGDVTRDVPVPVDAAACTAPGYAPGVSGVTETFDTAQVPPGWTVVDDAGSGGVWRFDDPGRRGNQTGGGGGFAVVDSDWLGFGGAQDTALVSPPADLSAVAAPTLEFATDYLGFPGSVGDVDVSGDGGATWSNVWHHTSDSVRQTPVRVDLPQLANRPAALVRFHFQASNGWWWQVDDVLFGARRCDPAQGAGVVAGLVTDANTGAGVDGAAVVSDDRPAERVLAAATPGDPALGDGLYRMVSSLSGPHPFSASRPNYLTARVRVDVAAHAVTRADFVVGAGHLSVSGDVAATLAMGTSTTAAVTFGNDGAAPVSVRLREGGGGVSVLDRSTAPPRRVVGDYDPHRRAGSGAAPATADPAPAQQPSTPDGPPWISLAALPAPVMDNAVAVGDDRRVYSVGGADATGAARSGVDVYDPAAGTWSSAAAMAQGRQQPAAAFVGGRLYVVGGWGTDGEPVARLEVYDPATDRWSTGPSVPTAYAASGVAVLDGRMYVVGGCDAAVCGRTEVYAYRPGDSAWTTVADYPRPVSWAACGGIDGRLYCAGGVADGGSSRSTYAYDPATDAWTPVADMPLDVWGAGYAASNGLLLVSGGAASGSSVITNQGFRYDPARDEWTDLPNANDALYRGGAGCGFYRVGGSSGGTAPSALVEQLPGLDQCSGVDVPWLSADPTSFTVQPGQSVTVAVRVDADVDQPGTYGALFGVATDTPYAVAPLGVTMQVTAPKSWGKVAGTVTGVGCDGASVALPGAVVQVATSAGTVYRLRTDADGRYGLWLDRQGNPLTVIVSAGDAWLLATARVRISGGRVTTLDVALTPSAGCG